MSKLVMALAFMCLIPVAAFPQDDLYFVPQELHEEYDTEMFDAPVEMPAVGSVRDVDEYNRRGTYYIQTHSLIMPALGI